MTLKPRANIVSPESGGRFGKTPPGPWRAALNDTSCSWDTSIRSLVVCSTDCSLKASSINFARHHLRSWR